MAGTRWTARGAGAKLAPARIDGMWAALGAASGMRHLPGIDGLAGRSLGQSIAEGSGQPERGLPAPREFQGLALARTKRKLAKMRAGKLGG